MVNGDARSALARRALNLLIEGRCAVGPEWTAAHEIAQAHEGDRLFDHVHAIVHRIEGDRANAAYWYRKSGLTMPNGPITDEIVALQREIAT